MRKILAVSLITAVMLMPAASYPQELWTSKDGSLRNVDTKAMIVDGQKMYIATRNEIYMARDQKKRWESIFFLPSGDNEIRCIAGNSKNILVGTRRGLFRSQDFGASWKNVFRTIIPEKSSVMTIDISRHDFQKMAIGTERGLFVSDDGGSRWRDVSGILKNKPVRCLTLNKTYLYAGADDGLYMTQYGSSDWQKVYTCQSYSDAGEPSDGTDEIEEPEENTISGVGSMALKEEKIFVATAKRISYSDDACKSWKDFPNQGLRGSINYMLVAVRSEKLYCATTKGLFEFSAQGNRWCELYNGMGKSVNMKSVVFGSEDEKIIWASTDKGLYRLDVGNIADEGYIDIEKNIRSMQVLFDNEPSFKELQAAAMRFNEVNPEKITQWRREARLKALVPKVSVGFDNSKSNTYEIYTSATKDYVIAGPDDVSEGFDMSVSWDLGNMIWSDDQTSIDNRSKLTTQLRNDILDDLRRAYFERKRLQFELINFPSRDSKMRFEKELRIQELTQAIDDLTGNYLSEHRKNI